VSDPESQPKPPPIERPNILNDEALDNWLERHLTHPPAGYDAMKNPDGTPFSEEQQLVTYRNQAKSLVTLVKAGKKSVEEITNSLVETASIDRAKSEKHSLEG
jgi:hypothetical protein